MNTFEMLSKIRASIAALVLLGIAELIVIDTSAAFVKMANLAGSGFFMAATGFIFLLSAVIICWSALKLRYSYKERLVEGIRAGVTTAFASSIGICAFMLLFALFGVGVPAMMPGSVTGQGAAMTVFAYLALCAVIIISYSAIGAVLGAISAVVSAPLLRERKLNLPLKPVLQHHKPEEKQHQASESTAEKKEQAAP